MKPMSFIDKILKPHENDLKRVQEDNRKLSEDTVNLVTGKQEKPKAVRDWENNRARW